jgi:hypothetical protein
LIAIEVELVALAVRVAVQLADAPGAKDAGAQVTPEICGAAVAGISFIVELAFVAFADPDICTSVLTVTAVNAVAVNEPVDAPAAMVTNVGTFTCAFEDASATATGAVAACERVTVHVAFPGATTDDGAHASVFTPVAPEEATAIDPPVAVLGIANPVPEALTGWTIAIGTDVVDGVEANCTDTTATVPFPIPVAFIPDTRQIVEPAEC